MNISEKSETTKDVDAPIKDGIEEEEPVEAEFGYHRSYRRVMKTLWTMCMVIALTS